MLSLNLIIKWFNCNKRALVLFCVSVFWKVYLLRTLCRPSASNVTGWRSAGLQKRITFTGESSWKKGQIECWHVGRKSWWNSHFKVESTNKSTNKTFKHSSVGVTHLCAPWVNCFVHIQQRLSLPTAYTLRPCGTAQVSATLACRCNRIINTSSQWKTQTVTLM